MSARLNSSSSTATPSRPSQASVDCTAASSPTTGATLAKPCARPRARRRRWCACMSEKHRLPCGAPHYMSKAQTTMWRSALPVKSTDPHALSTPKLGTQEIALTALASALGRRGGRARLPQALDELRQRLRLERAAQRRELGRVGRQRDEGWVPVPARAPRAPASCIRQRARHSMHARSGSLSWLCGQASGIRG